MSAMSTLNWRMKSTAASPTMPGRARAPRRPTTITSHWGWCSRMVATFRLLVMTRSPQWCSSAAATHSVVVPMLRISEQSLGTFAAMARAMRSFPLVQVFALGGDRCSQWWSWAPARRHESAQATFVGQALHIAAHGLQRDAEFVCQLLNSDRALESKRIITNQNELK
jgi:hypothetical protein